jgi:hypothetical protein
MIVMSPHVMDCISVARRYGNINNYIIVCSHAGALETCLDLALPCYNLSMMAENSVLAAPFEVKKEGELFNTPLYNLITFQRVILADALFK